MNLVEAKNVAAGAMHTISLIATANKSHADLAKAVAGANAHPKEVLGDPNHPIHADLRTARKNHELSKTAYASHMTRQAAMETKAKAAEAKTANHDAAMAKATVDHMNAKTKVIQHIGPEHIKKGGATADSLIHDPVAPKDVGNAKDFAKKVGKVAK